METARSAPLPFPAPQELTGRSVGPFVICHELAAGGMGEGYYAEDTTLHRPVALRRVNRKLVNNPEARRHIQREALRVSALNSQQIAAVWDVLEEDRELFLVKEYEYVD